MDGGSLPLICEKCGSEMRIVAFIIDPEQIERIMQYLIKNFNNTLLEGTFQ